LPGQSLGIAVDTNQSDLGSTVALAGSRGDQQAIGECAARDEGFGAAEPETVACIQSVSARSPI